MKEIKRFNEHSWDTLVRFVYLVDLSLLVAYVLRGWLQDGRSDGPCFEVRTWDISQWVRILSFMMWFIVCSREFWQLQSFYDVFSLHDQVYFPAFLCDILLRHCFVVRANRKDCDRRLFSRVLALWVGVTKYPITQNALETNEHALTVHAKFSCLCDQARNGAFRRTYFAVPAVVFCVIPLSSWRTSEPCVVTPQHWRMVQLFCTTGFRTPITVVATRHRCVSLKTYLLLRIMIYIYRGFCITTISKFDMPHWLIYHGCRAWSSPCCVEIAVLCFVFTKFQPFFSWTVRLLVASARFSFPASMIAAQAGCGMSGTATARFRFPPWTL